MFVDRLSTPQYKPLLEILLSPNDGNFETDNVEN